jgi:hypothetical protein
MTQSELPHRMRGVVRREWIIVVAAAVIGLVVAAIVANGETTTQWKATQLVTVATYSGGMTNTSKAEIFVTAASTPSVLRAAEEELGLQRGALGGTVSSQIVTVDKSTVSISAAGSSEKEAEERVKAVTGASVDYVLAPYEGYFAIRDEAAAASEARAKELAADVKRLEKAAASASPAERAGYYQALVDAKAALYQAQQDAQTASQGSDLIRASVYVDPMPKTSSASSGGVQVAAMLQGLLLGIVAGVVVAGVREWLRARRTGT